MKNLTQKITILLIGLFTLLGAQAQSQCKVVNNAFKSGETISYDLYFNYGLINTRAGRGSMNIQMVDYKGVSAYNTRLIFNTSGLVGSVFTVSDTLVSYIDMDLRPLLFSKNAHEGKDHSKEIQVFSYEEDQIKIRTNRIFNDKKRFDETLTTDECTYDFLSVFPYIRNLDYSDMKAGESKTIQYISGKKIAKMAVTYKGKSRVKANNGKTYNTIDISLTIARDAFKDAEEAISASLTDDDNRIPILLNTHLKVGAIRGVLRDAQNLRN